jgi:hypothetical protein
MILFRRICLALVAASALLLFYHRSESLPALPVPPAGRLVRAMVTIAAAGDYSVCVSMPKIDDSLGLASEVVPCSMVVSIAKEGKPEEKEEITSLSRYAEIGFGRIQLYRGGEAFRLGRGEYEIEVASRGSCLAAADRGATLSLEQDVGNPTDFYLRNLLRSWLLFVALCGGLLGLIACEFRKPNKAAEPTRTSGTPPADAGDRASGARGSL